MLAARRAPLDSDRRAVPGARADPGDARDATGAASSGWRRRKRRPRLLVATYFGGLGENLPLVRRLRTGRPACRPRARAGAARRGAGAARSDGPSLSARRRRRAQRLAHRSRRRAWARPARGQSPRRRAGPRGAVLLAAARARRPRGRAASSTPSSGAGSPSRRRSSTRFAPWPTRGDRRLPVGRRRGRDATSARQPAIVAARRAIPTCARAAARSTTRCSPRRSPFAVRIAQQQARFGLPATPDDDHRLVPADGGRAQPPGQRGEPARLTAGDYDDFLKAETARCIASRRSSGSTSSCTANSSATTWSSTSASSSKALPSPRTAGCRAMARAA